MHTTHTYTYLCTWLHTYICTRQIETWHCIVACINGFTSKYQYVDRLELEAYASEAPRESCADQAIVIVAVIFDCCIVCT